MKRFLRNSIVLSVGIITLLYGLDFIYTNVYENSFPRNKTQHILNLEEGEKLDYVFLGSSRVENSIVSREIENITGKRTINLGTQGAKLDDINIFLRLLIEKNVKIEKLFIQVDYIFNHESSSDIVRSQALPYIKTNSVIKEYLKRVDSNYFKNYYLPFYRYAKNDYRLGFREFIASLVNKKSKIDFNDGFVPLFGVINKNDFGGSELPQSILKSNKSLKEIDSLCKMNKIDVIYFCAPFCSRLKTNDYLMKLKEKLPNFKDFSSSIPSDSLFQNCSHLNKNGAEVFSKLLIESLSL
ncbi:hypothetical protein F6U93_11480 [Tamlana haliotis]|uniref:DUF1574 domain-containing protein n=1 Tax=Pseudotamlana haliotis TaxID=2614804 RepID=A0A6N6MDL1_9FLAO|nr:hypothetical protein [Tamlana haliotis]KAB1067036.1 hypothetical protein F6U93_11480 [Tamlana haliotis]